MCLERHLYGEFHTLYDQLRKYPNKFFEYTRMSINTFDYILNEIRFVITRSTTNFCKPISAEERLFLTIK